MYSGVERGCSVANLGEFHVREVPRGSVATDLGGVQEGGRPLLPEQETFGI